MPRSKTNKKQGKTLWSDIGDLRKPNANWRLGKAALWWAKRLGLPKGSVVFLNPDGSRARSNKTLGALRRDWKD